MKMGVVVCTLGNALRREIVVLSLLTTVVV